MSNEIKCYYNVCDDSWWTVDEQGVCRGIGETPVKSISAAEFWGLDCVDVTVYSERNYF